MQLETRRLPTDGGESLFVRHWTPDDGVARGVVVIAHGVAEHGDRYARFAEALVGAGFAVFAHDHRGHGKTAGSLEQVGHFADRDGWQCVVDDLAHVISVAAAAHPDVPRVLFAHSMGSSLAVTGVIRDAGLVDLLVLSGPVGCPPPLVYAGRLITRVERARVGARNTSPIVNKLIFGDYNRDFAPARTTHDWLSRDEAEVDKYVADPYCGFDMSTEHWVGHLDALARFRDPEYLSGFPKHVPLLVVAGTADPVGGKVRQIEKLLGRLASAGVRDVEHRFWPDARHELLNETVRDEVTETIIAWLDRKCARLAEA